MPFSPQLELQLQRNVTYLEQFDSALSVAVSQASRDLQWVSCAESDWDLDLLVDGQMMLSAVRQTVLQTVIAQCQSPSRVMMQRLQASRLPISVRQLMQELLDSETLVTTTQLQALQPDFQPKTDRRDKIRFENSLLPPHSLLVGSLCLVGHDFLLQQPHLHSIVLLESDPVQLAASLALIDFQDFVLACRQKNLRFNLIFDQNLGDKSGATARILDHYASHNPVAFHALALIRSPVLSPDLIKAAAWMEAPDGFLDLAKGYLGNDTDEFNQVLHALYAGAESTQHSVQLLSRDLEPHQHPAVLVASGPSLNEQLTWLQAQQQHLTIIAAGSALGSLLRGGIQPDAVVLLEMSSIVYQDLLDLICEGHDLKSLVAVVSATVDPRIAAIFDQCLVFQRPLSSALCLFPEEQCAALPQAGPQAANAALETLLRLGFRDLLLVGCDFGTADRSQERAQGAMGISPRTFDLPVAGARGKTVFSNAELSSTRQLFEHALLLYGANAVALGEGSRLKGVEHWQRSADELLSRFSVQQKGVFHALVASFPFRAVDIEALRAIVAEAAIANTQLLAELKQALRASQSLDQTVTKAWNRLISWKDHEASAGERLHRRITRFLIFFALQPLVFDSPNGIVDWHDRIQPVIASLDQIQELYSSYYGMLNDILSFKVVPGWDSAWLKRRIQLGLRDRPA